MIIVFSFMKSRTDPGNRSDHFSYFTYVGVYVVYVILNVVFVNEFSDKTLRGEWIDIG